MTHERAIAGIGGLYHMVYVIGLGGIRLMTGLQFRTHSREYVPRSIHASVVPLRRASEDQSDEVAELVRVGAVYRTRLFTV